MVSSGVPVQLATGGGPGKAGAAPGHHVRLIAVLQGPVHAISVSQPEMSGHIATAWLAQVAPPERAQHDAPPCVAPGDPIASTAIVAGARGCGSRIERRRATDDDGAAAITVAAVAAATAANHTTIAPAHAVTPRGKRVLELSWACREWQARSLSDNGLVVAATAVAGKHHRKDTRTT
jgi:hypothetical protein